MSETDKPAQYAAFISYASQNKETAFDIVNSLEKRGMKCWVAPRDVRPGEDYPAEIIRGIERSNCLVLVLSEAANNSKFVRREVERAVNYGKPIFPIRIEDVLPSTSLELLVSTTHWIDAWTGSLFDHVDKLVHQLNDDNDVPINIPIKTLSNKDKVTRFVRRNAVSIVAVIAMLLFGIITITNMSTSNAPQNIEDASDLSKDDISVTGSATGIDQDYYIIVGPARAESRLLLQNADYLFSFDNGDFVPLSKNNLVSNIGQGFQSFGSETLPPPDIVSLKVIDSSGNEAGPFEFELNLKAQVEEFAKIRNEMESKSQNRSLQAMKANITNGQTFTCKDFLSAGSLCTIFNFGGAISNSYVKSIKLGYDLDNLESEFYPDDMEKNKGVAFSLENNRNGSLVFLAPFDASQIIAIIEFSDGDKSDPITFNVNRWGNEHFQFKMKPEDNNAPILLAHPDSTGMLYQNGGQWAFVPVVGDEVSKIKWSTYEGGENKLEKRDGFYNFSFYRGTDLGITDFINGGEEPVIWVTFEYTNGDENTYRYKGDWQNWFQQISLNDIDFEELISCSDRLSHGNLNNMRVKGNSPINTACRLNAGETPAKLFSEIYWGYQPTQLEPLQDPDTSEFIEKHRELRINNLREMNNNTQTPINEQRFKEQEEKIASGDSFETQTFYFLSELYKPWEMSVSGDYILLLPEPNDFLYFKFKKIDGSESPITRVTVEKSNLIDLF